MLVSDTIGFLVAGAAMMIMNELQNRFSNSHIMNSLYIMYPQLWLGEVLDRELHMHLSIIKQYWGQPKQIQITLKKIEYVPELLSSAALDKQLDCFRISIINNAQSAMRAIDTHILPITKLWRNLSLSSYLTTVFPEYFKLAELAMIMISIWCIFLQFLISKHLDY